jgi:glycosyltransferase involved in cell wall biosynthesis
VFSRLPAADRVIERRLLAATRTFDIMVTMGNRAATFFEERNGRRPHVLPGGIDAAKFAPAPDDAEELILVGRLVAVKQVDLFLHAVERIRQSVPHVRARIVGDGPLRRDLEGLAAELGLADAVVFVGQCEPVEIELRRAGIFVLTSASEGVSLALMEALMCGLPAVVPDVGDLRDVVEDGVNGFVVTSPTVDAFADRITTLLRDPALRRRLGAAARAIAMKHEVAAVASRWDDILATLGEGEAPAR